MISKKHFINIISLSSIYFVNIFFINAYSPILSINKYWLGIIYTFAFLFVVIFIDRIVKKNVFDFKKFYLLLLFFIEISIFIYIKYLTSSNWFFYIFFSLGLLLFYLQLSKYKETKKEFYFVSILTFISPVVYLEFAVWNESLIFAILFTSIILLAQYCSLDEKINFYFFTIPSFIVILIIFNYYFIFLIPVFILYFFRMNLKYGAIFFLLTVVTITLIFILADIYQFKYFNFNSFKSNFNSYSIYVLMIIFFLSFYFGWIIADLQELFFLSGLILFLLSFYFGYNNTMVKKISEVSLCIPFFLLALKEYEVDYYLGKIYRLNEK